MPSADLPSDLKSEIADSKYKTGLTSSLDKQENLRIKSKFNCISFSQSSSRKTNLASECIDAGSWS